MGLLVTQDIYNECISVGPVKLSMGHARRLNFQHPAIRPHFKLARQSRPGFHVQQLKRMKQESVPEVFPPKPIFSGKLTTIINIKAFAHQSVVRNES